MKLFSQEQEKNLKFLYGSGSNDYDVAKIFHVGRNRLRDWRRLNSIPSKTNKRGLKDTLCSEILCMLDEGKTLTDVSRFYGVNRTSISRRLRRNGFLQEPLVRSRPKGIDQYCLNSFQVSVLMGDMFGDGHICRSSTKAAYYYCGHCTEQEAFVRWKYDVFSPLSCRFNKTSSVVSMSTWSCPMLSEWRNSFYPHGSKVKILSPSFVSAMDKVSLAVWFMGDGTRSQDRMHYVAGLQVDGEALTRSLNMKFGNIFKAHRYNRQWDIDITDPDRFINMVETHILPIFKYKLCSSTGQASKSESK